MSNAGRQFIRIVEIDRKRCSLTYGESPCAAQLGVTGERKCTNSLANCQDQENFTAETATDRHIEPQEGIAQYLPAYPDLVSVSQSPMAINLAGMDKGSRPLGKRASVTAVFRDHQDDDHGQDPYRLERATGDAMSSGEDTYDSYERGTLWGKWLARNPYYSAYAFRVYEGYVGDDIDDMRVARYIIDRVEREPGEVTLVAKDLFSKIEARKAVAPFPSKGELQAAITGTPATFQVLPAGIGDVSEEEGGYAPVGTSTDPQYVAIGDELILVDRSGDVFEILERGALGTEAEDHDAEDLVQLVFSAVSEAPHEIAYRLCTGYSKIAAALIDKTGEWDPGAVGITDRYTGYVAKPTPVEDLIGELEQQAGFTIWPDLSTGMVRFAPLRAGAGTVTVTDDGWIVDDSISVKRHDTKRASRVLVYYAQKNPAEDLTDERNYRSRVLRPDIDEIVDLEGEDKYDAAAIENVFSRWIPQNGRAAANRVGDRIAGMFLDPPWEARFRLKDAREGELDYARLFTLETDEIQDDTGAPDPTTMATVEIGFDEDEIEYGAQQVSFTQESDGDDLREVVIEDTVYNVNFRTLHDQIFSVPTGDSPGERVEIFVDDGGVIGSTSVTEYAADTGEWPEGVELTLTVNGRIQGRGGRGGKGGGTGSSNGANGQDGGDALLVRYPITITGHGKIWAGAGGGGGGARSKGPPVADDVIAGGGSGGGGAGTDPGAERAGGDGDKNAHDGGDGAAGTADSAGAGGARGIASFESLGTEFFLFGGLGGNGGAPGEDGQDGTTHLNPSGTATGSNPGDGGAAGRAIDGVSLVDFASTELDIRGAQVN